MTTPPSSYRLMRCTCGGSALRACSREKCGCRGTCREPLEHVAPANSSPALAQPELVLERSLVRPLLLDVMSLLHATASLACSGQDAKQATEKNSFQTAANLQRGALRVRQGRRHRCGRRRRGHQEDRQQRPRRAVGVAAAVPRCRRRRLQAHTHRAARNDTCGHASITPSTWKFCAGTSCEHHTQRNLRRDQGGAQVADPPAVLKWQAA